MAVPAVAAAAAAGGFSLANNLVSNAFTKFQNDQARDAQDETNRQNERLQKEFAQNGLRWKVEDARRAGLHPLAVLGGSGYNAAPSFVGPSTLPMDFSRGGQDISGAIARTMTAPERGNALAELQLENMKAQNQGQNLENEFRKLQIIRLGREMKSTPAMPDLHLGDRLLNAPSEALNFLGDTNYSKELQKAFHDYPPLY